MAMPTRLISLRFPIVTHERMAQLGSEWLETPRQVIIRLVNDAYAAKYPGGVPPQKVVWPAVTPHRRHVESEAFFDRAAAEERAAMAITSGPSKPVSLRGPALAPSLEPETTLGMTFTTAAAPPTPPPKPHTAADIADLQAVLDLLEEDE